MGFVRNRRRFGGKSLAAALLGTTLLVGLAGPALADSHLESENAELRSMVEDLMQEVQILKNMVVEQGNKMAEMGEPAEPAKMVESGKDKVSLKVYGQVNRMLLLASDGNESRLFNADNDMSSTRVGFKGEAKMDGGWSAGTTVEVQMESNSSAKVHLGDDGDDINTGKESFSERKLELWVKSKAAGKFSIGQGSTASDGVAEADLSGTGVISGSGSGGALGADVRFVDSDGNSHSKVDGIFDNLDGHSRKDRLRYDSPSIGGFQVSTSLQSGRDDGDSGPWDVAVRYGRDLDGFEVEAIAAQWVNGDDTGLGGSASVLAPSGTSFTVAYATEEDGDGSARMTYAKLGQKLDINPAGSTALSIGFMNAENADGDGGSAVDVAVVQKAKSLGAEFYGVYGLYEADIAGAATNDVTVAGVGARIKF
ncbi:MAG: hypothetical protein OXP75_14980 [Rhodospirillales bacterium]|nr:hypothetical protein [Rhodospirillales bacterium]